MNTSLLRTFSIGIASLAISSAVFGATDMDSRVTQLENQMQQVRTKTPMGTYGAKTAIARADVDGYGWFISGDLIFWQPKLNGTDFTYKASNLNASTSFRAEMKQVSFDWSVGFRCGLGYNFEHDGWELGAQYTYFRPDDQKKVTSTGVQSLVPLKGSLNIPTLSPVSLSTVANPAFRVAQLARQAIDILHHNLDLSLGRAYYVSGKLSLRPHWGVRSSWMNIEKTTYYNGTPSCQDDVSSLGLGCNFFSVKDNSDFWGLGPRVGCDSKWYLGNGVSIFGNIAGALTYGFFDVDHIEETNITAGVPQFIDFNRADLHGVVPTAQLFAGLRFDSYVNNNKQHFGIVLGYEVNYWWRIDQSIKVNDSATSNYERVSEDLAFHGVTFEVKLDF